MRVQEVTIACSVAAVQLALLCSSQTGINCLGVAQNTCACLPLAAATCLPAMGWWQ